jgi:hypothetical protein
MFTMFNNVVSMNASGGIITLDTASYSYEMRCCNTRNPLKLLRKIGSITALQINLIYRIYVYRIESTLFFTI